MLGEVEVIEIDIESMFACLGIDTALLPEIVEQEIGLADSSSAFSDPSARDNELVRVRLGQFNEEGTALVGEII